MCLREKAISWYHSLENINNFDYEIWTALSREFLEAYAPKYTARTLSVALQEIWHFPGENIQDYYNRISDAFRIAFKIKPAAVVDYTGTDAKRGALTAAEAGNINAQGVVKMQLHMMNILYLGRL